MSHFRVTVCLTNDGLPELTRAARAGPAVLKDAIEHRLEIALAPFDENREVELREADMLVEFQCEQMSKEENNHANNPA